MNASDIKCVVGKKFVIGSGIIHTENNETIELFIRNWSCLIKFENEENTESRYVSELVDNKLVIRLINHTNPLSESITTPFIIAGLNGKNIYMTYETALLNPTVSARRFHYTIWMDQ